MPGRRLSFGPFQVDQGAQVVLREGQPLAIGARGVRLLEALLRRPGEVLTKAELMDAAWPGTAVEESNLSVQIASLRRALADGGEVTDWIATVPRVGYRFTGPAGGEDAPVQANAARRAIAVLPFANLSSDPEQAFFADGLAEEIITALSKLPGLLVISRNSSFAYRGDGIDLRKVAQDLDVTYVVTGSVRRSGDRLRMGVQLAEAGTAAQLWAESYDRRLTDVFEVQDDITRQVVAALTPQVTGSAELPPASATSDFAAFVFFLRGRDLTRAAVQDKQSIAEGIEALRAAVERDPDYVDPLVSLTIAHVTMLSNGWADDPAATTLAARDAAERAIALAPSSGEARAARALVAMLEKDHDRQATEAETAVALAPDSALANLMRGGYLVNDGRPLLAIPFYERAIRVDPGMAHMFIHHLGTAYLFAQRYETAAALFRSRIALAPRTDMSRAYLCVALGHLGLVEEARRVWDELMEITPSYSLSDRLSWWHYRNPADPARLLEGLRKAGLPTGERADA